MLTLLRRVDSFLGTDSSFQDTALNLLFNWITPVSRDDINSLNTLTDVELQKLENHDVTKQRIKDLIQKHVQCTEGFPRATSVLTAKHKIQFFDALLCHIYHQIKENVRDVMSGDNFFREKCFLKQIELHYLHNTPCMQTKQSVLEYAVCEDTATYWRDFTYLSTWFDIIVSVSYTYIGDMKRRISPPQGDPHLMQYIETTGQKMEQEYLAKVSECYTNRDKTTLKNLDQFSDALLCHIFHEIPQLAQLIMKGKGYFNTTLLKQIEPCYLLTAPRCMQTKADVLDYAICKDTVKYWDTFNKDE